MISKQKIIVLIGVPGCGKGMLANNLIKEYGFKHISTGDLFRTTIKQNTPLAERLRSIVARGALVDDQTTNEVIKTEMTKLLVNNDSIILDGYPRTKQQAHFLETIIKPSLVLLISIKRELAEKEFSAVEYVLFVVPHIIFIFINHKKKIYVIVTKQH